MFTLLAFTSPPGYSDTPCPPQHLPQSVHQPTLVPTRGLPATPLPNQALLGLPPITGPARSCKTTQLPLGPLGPASQSHLQPGWPCHSSPVFQCRLQCRLLTGRSRVLLPAHMLLCVFPTFSKLPPIVFSNLTKFSATPKSSSPLSPIHGWGSAALYCSPKKKLNKNLPPPGVYRSSRVYNLAKYKICA